jgi:hypothetical protein
MLSRQEIAMTSRQNRNSLHPAAVNIPEPEALCLRLFITPLAVKAFNYNS